MGPQTNLPNSQPQFPPLSLVRLALPTCPGYRERNRLSERLWETHEVFPPRELCSTVRQEDICVNPGDPAHYSQIKQAVLLPLVTATAARLHTACSKDRCMPGPAATGGPTATHDIPPRPWHQEPPGTRQSVTTLGGNPHEGSSKPALEMGILEIQHLAG